MPHDDETQDHLEKMLGSLDGPAAAGAAPSSPTLPLPLQPGPEPYESPVLVSLDSTRLPQPLPTCGICPKALWSSRSDSLQCFCRVMHLVTWSSEQPELKPIQLCDGVLGRDE